MEKYENIIKAVIGVPQLEVKVSNPYPIIGETVTLNSTGKWLDRHNYLLNDGRQESREMIATVLGKSSKDIVFNDYGEIQQIVNGENASGGIEVRKTIYVSEAAVEPYFSIAVTKEIIRTDGETTRIILSPESGYDFQRDRIIAVRVYDENTDMEPALSLSGMDFILSGKELHSTDISLDARGAYDIEVDYTDVERGTTFSKRINKLITVTPALAPRPEAYEFLIPDAKKAGNVQDWYIDGKNYPAGSTIVLKADPDYGVDYPMRLKLLNFQGTWEKPYIITIDQDTQLVMNWYYYFGINLENCKHIVFDGRGYQNISKGIKLQPLPEDNTMAISAGNFSEEMEFFEIEINGSGFAGMSIKTDPEPNDPNKWYDNFKFNRLLIHHMYIHDTEGEGVYLGYFSASTKTGTNSAGEQVTYRAHHMYNCRIYRCLFLRNGYDAIQWNNAEKLEICYNELHYSGTRGEKDQTTGMSLGLSGKIYNNVIKDYQGPGIQFGVLGELHIFNNLIINGKAGSGGLLLLANLDVPEQNPNDQGYNNIPIYIYNNIITAISANVLNSRNTSQHLNVHVVDNFCISKYSLFAGQETATIAEWEKNAKNNISVIAKALDFVALDNTYRFADSANGDYRITKDSSLMNAGEGSRFNFDFRGYRNWYQGVFPVGPYMGIVRNSGVDETFRILSVTFDDDVTQTINAYCMVSWQAYGTTPIKEYRISEDRSFTDVAWQPYTVETGGQFRYDFAGTNKGKRTIYVQLKNEADQITEPFGKDITWIFRTALIGVNATGNPAVDGVFNEDTGIVYIRFQNKAGSVFNFKDILGNKMGTIQVDKSYTTAAAEGLITGGNSGLFPDIVLQKCEAVRFDTVAKTVDDPTNFTLEINPGNYRISILSNSNKTNTYEEAISTAASYFKYSANGVVANAVLLKNNFDTLVEMDNVIVGEDKVLTISAYWDEAVTKQVSKASIIFGTVNLIKIEEI